MSSLFRMPGIEMHRDVDGIAVSYRNLGNCLWNTTVPSATRPARIPRPSSTGKRRKASLS